MLVAKDGPDSVGATHRNYTSCGEKSRPFLAAMVEAVGLSTSAVETLLANVDNYKKHAASAKVLDGKAKGKQFACLVVDDAQGGYVNSKLVVNSILPAKDFVKGAAPAAKPKSTEVQPPATNGSATPPPPPNPPEKTDDELAADFDAILAAASA